MRIFLIGFLILVLSSCVDIWDDIALHADGSGTYKYTVNMSASKVKINSILALDSVDGKRIPKLPEIKEKIEYKGMKDVEVKFPLIEDITMEVSKKYGMIMEGESNTKAVRAVFFVDPKGTIRTILYYPLSIGRNFDEIYRALIALQTADAFEVACPADWRPGDDVIVPTAGSCGVAKERMDDVENLDCKDWFFCTKKLDKDLVLNTVLKK